MKNKETLEEAGDRELSFIADFLSNNVDFVTGFRTGMVLGAKWQQERSYSEEEVKFIESLISFYWVEYNSEHPANLEEFELSKSILKKLK